jgi:hypothetical protein
MLWSTISPAQDFERDEFIAAYNDLIRVASLPRCRGRKVYAEQGRICVVRCRFAALHYGQKAKLQMPVMRFRLLQPGIQTLELSRVV